MKKISSGQTFFLKRVFPFLFLLPVAVLIRIVLLGSATGKSVDPLVLLPLGLMLVVVAVVYRKLIWDLADEVQDGGTFLLVRRRGIEERVQLADVLNVSMTQFTNPPRLSMRLARPGKFGDEIVFVPTLPGFRLNPFARNAIAEDLIQRVDRARREAR